MDPSPQPYHPSVLGHGWAPCQVLRGAGSPGQQEVDSSQQPSYKVSSPFCCWHLLEHSGPLSHLQQPDRSSLSVAADTLVLPDEATRETPPHFTLCHSLLPLGTAVVTGIARGTREGLDRCLSLKGGQRNSKIGPGQPRTMPGHGAQRQGSTSLSLTGCSRLVLPSGEATLQSCCNETPQSTP